MNRNPLYYDLPEKAIPLRKGRDIVQQRLHIIRVTKDANCRR